MRRTTLTLAACGLCLTAGLATLAISQPGDDPMEIDPAMVVEMLKQGGQPGEEHKAMAAKMAGEWTFEASFQMEPGAAPEISTGTAQVEAVLGGVALLGRTNMDFSFAGQKIPMMGISLMGYNRTTGQYESVWMDTLDPVMLVQKGEMKGNTMALDGGGTGMQGEYKMKNVYTFNDDGTYTLDFYQPDPTNPNGEWPKIGSIAYKRK